MGLQPQHRYPHNCVQDRTSRRDALNQFYQKSFQGTTGLLITSQGNQLDVSMADEALYISASDNILNKKKGGYRPTYNPYQMAFNPYQQYMYQRKQF
jgi:hypothetical protein